jgi:hypothetical protein
MKLALAGVAVLVVVLVAAAGPAPATESAAAACRGGLTLQLGGATLQVRAIRTRAMSCRSGKRLIRRFFERADSERRCCRQAERSPPTPGCAVGRFRCWRGLAKYCARRSQDVSWRDRPA